VFTQLDRAGQSVLSSRLGLQVPAVEVEQSLDLREHVVGRLSAGERIDYLICDEAQFYTEAQVEQLAAIVDDLRIDVYAFGIMTDFRTRLFPGSARLVELADRVQVLQVEALCWCGARAIHNARTVGGQMVVEGSQVVVGDTASSASDDDVAPEPGEVSYEVLCRTHYRAHMTAARAGQAHISPQPLPFA
jgi:thymidine kinase